MFDKKGYLLVEKSKVSEDTLMTVALDAGAEDMKNDPKEDNFEVITAPEDLNKVKNALEDAGIPVSLAETTMLPKSYLPVDEKTAEQTIRLIEVLEENEDVQNVYANFDVPDEVMTKASK
jgi:transcriptional/translational regulatory protein YebC/TACO1